MDRVPPASIRQMDRTGLNLNNGREITIYNAEEKISPFRISGNALMINRLLALVVVLVMLRLLIAWVKPDLILSMSMSMNSIVIPNKLNTSNPGKLAEFKLLFTKYGHNITNTSIDLAEVDADALTVIVHKASSVNGANGGVIVEDTSLDIEGEDVGVNIRWLLSNLDKYEGKKASWKVLLAFRHGDNIYISQGLVTGQIVKQSGTSGFGFDPYFMPDNATKTLAEYKPDSVNARALAVEAMINQKFEAVLPAIENWNGGWQ